jgi:hypothetical protein
VGAGTGYVAGDTILGDNDMSTDTMGKLAELDDVDQEVLPRKLYRLDKIAAVVGLYEDSLREAAADGKLAVYQTGCGLFLTTAADVRRWLLRILEKGDTRI